MGIFMTDPCRLLAMNFDKPTGYTNNNNARKLVLLFHCSNVPDNSFFSCFCVCFNYWYNFKCIFHLQLNCNRCLCCFVLENRMKLDCVSGDKIVEICVSLTSYGLYRLYRIHLKCWLFKILSISVFISTTFQFVLRSKI